MTSGVDKEFFGQNTHHFPLFGVGVLRFVNQDVIKAFVELEQHPSRHAGLTLQKAQAGQDQIIIIKAGMQRLFRRITVQHRVANGDQGRRRPGHRRSLGTRFPRSGKEHTAILTKYRKPVFDIGFFQKLRQGWHTCLIGFGSGLKGGKPAHQTIAVKGIV